MYQFSDEKTTDDWLGEEVHWLELSCWVEMEIDTIEFYGIKPSGVNLKTREFMDKIPGIPTGGRSEQQTQNGSFPLSVESLLGFTPDENTSSQQSNSIDVVRYGLDDELIKLK